MRLRYSAGGCSVLYIYEGFKNLGDGFVYIGARYVMQSSIAIGSEQFLILRDARALHLLKRHFPDECYLALGIGSCVTKSHCLTADEQATAAACVDPVLGQFDLVTARDPVAHAMLSALGIPAVCLPCPSIFLPAAFPPPSEIRAGTRAAILTPPSAMWHYQHLEVDVIANYARFLTSIPADARHYVWLDQDMAGLPRKDHVPQCWSATWRRWRGFLVS